MNWRNSKTAWGRVTCLVHWLSVILLLAIAAVGVAAVEWRMSPTKFDLYIWHKSLGMIMLVLAAWRIGWTLYSPAPGLPGDLASWQRRLATVVRYVLYVLMIAAPVSGWLLNSAADVPLKWFWLVRLPDLVGPDKGLKELFTAVHNAVVIALLVFAALHVAGAFSHGRAFIGRLCK